MSLAGRLFALQLLAAFVVGAAVLTGLVLDGRARAEQDAAALGLAVSRTVSQNPWVVDTVDRADATALLEPYALQLVRRANVDFVTIMTPSGIRITHPDPTQIGLPFRGTITTAQRGRELTETFTGTLGPSVRAVVPIERDGRLVGIVSAGVTTGSIGSIVLSRLPFAVGIAALVAGLGAAVAAVALVWTRRATGRLTPGDTRRMLDFYESVLHSVREGVVLTDRQQRVVLYNDEAADLLGLPPAGSARLPASVEALGIDEGVADPLRSGRRLVEATLVARGTVLLANQEPARRPDRPREAPVGTVMTLRDQSVLQHLSGELDSVRTLSSALSAQAHDFSNTLHTLVSLLELGRIDEAKSLITSSTRSSQDLTDAVLAQTEDPVLAALLVGKAAQAGERGVMFHVELSSAAALPLPGPAVVSLLGNLLDNAIEAAARADGDPRGVSVRLTGADGWVRLVVEDSGAGFGERPQDWFDVGATTKRDAEGRHGLGLAVVRSIVEEADGSVEVLGAPTRVVVRIPERTT